MSKQTLTLNLIENAKDSLAHAVEHLICDGKTLGTGDYKRVLLDVSHALELILKERIRRIHPGFLWKNVEDCNDRDKKTIGLEDAITRLFKLENICLTDHALKTVRTCRRIRNQIEHYEFELATKEARILVGRMLSFIFMFSKKYLLLDLENDFRKEGKWADLVEIYEFFEEHSRVLEKELSEQKKWVIECPNCGAQTFDDQLERCLLCDHHEAILECDKCNEQFFESETTTHEECDEGGSYCYTICNACEKSRAEEAQADMYYDR